MGRLNAILVGLRNFSTQPLTDAFLILTIWTTYLIPILVAGVAVSHITGILLVMVSAKTIVQGTSRQATNVFLLFFALISLSAASAAFVGYQARFPFEAIKTVIVFIIAYFAGLSIPAARIRELLEPGPWLFLILIAGVFAYIGNPFGLDGRLQIEGFISSNVLGFLAVMNIAILLNRPRMYTFDYATLICLGLITLLCLSRSAVLGALALLWVRIGWGRGAIIFGSVATSLGIIFSGSKIIQRMLVVEDVLTTGGSGRSDLWSYLMSNWLHTPSNWLFGFGPGAVHRHPAWLATQENAHSMVVGSLYYWGVAGFLFVAGLFVLGAREIAKAPHTPERSLARDILLVMITNSVVDESYNASQVNAISAILFALVLAVIVEGRRKRSAALIPSMMLTE